MLYFIWSLLSCLLVFAMARRRKLGLAAAPCPCVIWTLSPPVPRWPLLALPTTASNPTDTVHTPNSNCTAIHHGHQPRLAQAVHDRRLVSRGRPPCPRCSWMALLTGRPSPSPHCSDSGDFECERRPRHARLARMHPCYAPAWPCPSHLSCCSCSSPFARSPARSLVRLARSGSPGGLRTAVAAVSGGEGGPS